ncbi:hypothetical protein [Azospirillum doebereinerae]
MSGATPPSPARPFPAPLPPALRPLAEAPAAALVARLRAAEAGVTVNSLWVLGWFGGYEKLGMARRVMRDVHGLDIDATPDAVAYAGDSINDGPMFAHSRTSVGVSTVVDFLPELPKAPAWITRGPGGDGFVELADALLAARRHARPSSGATPRRRPS